jgi:hypothetical protein
LKQQLPALLSFVILQVAVGGNHGGNQPIRTCWKVQISPAALAATRTARLISRLQLVSIWNMSGHADLTQAEMQ